jgi:hypothetical protein
MVGGSLRVLPASSTTKTGCHDIAEILLKVALNTNNQINQSRVTLKLSGSMSTAFMNGCNSNTLL